MAHFSAQWVRGANHRSPRKAEVKPWARWLSETGFSACLIQSNNLKSSSGIFLFKKMKISFYESFPCSLFTLHYWAHTGTGLPRGQEGHSPLPALPVKGTLHITHGSSSAMRSPLSSTAAAPPPVHLLFSHCTLAKRRQYLHPTADTCNSWQWSPPLTPSDRENHCSSCTCNTPVAYGDDCFHINTPLLFFMPRAVPAVVLYCRFWNLIKKTSTQ